MDLIFDRKDKPSLLPAGGDCLDSTTVAMVTKCAHVPALTICLFPAAACPPVIYCCTRLQIAELSCHSATRLRAPSKKVKTKKNRMPSMSAADSVRGLATASASGASMQAALPPKRDPEPSSPSWSKRLSASVSNLPPLDEW